MHKACSTCQVLQVTMYPVSFANLVQDHKRSKELQVQKATERKLEAVDAAGSLKGKLRALSREKSSLEEQVKVGVPLHDWQSL